MNGRFFLDTNVFAYSFDASAPQKAIRANKLIRTAVDSRQGIISFQVVQEFFSLAFRRFATPMTVAEAEQYLATVFRPLLAIQSSQALYGAALHIYERFQLSWYDALIVAAAIEGQCKVLYSEDLRTGQRIDSVEIANPFV